MIQYGSKICSQSYKLEDCIHDLFMELWESPSRPEINSVKAYLLKSLKYKLIKSLNLRESLQPDDMAFRNMPFVISHEDFIVENDEEKNRSMQIIAAVNKLPSRQKEIIYLRFYKGFSYEEISEVMDINYQVSRNLFYQAMKSLRHYLTAK